MSDFISTNYVPKSYGSAIRTFLHDKMAHTALHFGVDGMLLTPMQLFNEVLPQLPKIAYLC